MDKFVSHFTHTIKLLGSNLISVRMHETTTTIFKLNFLSPLPFSNAIVSFNNRYLEI